MIQASYAIVPDFFNGLLGRKGLNVRHLVRIARQAANIPRYRSLAPYA